MKKIVSLTAALAAATVALSACHPPNEQPTDQKVKTASEVAAPTASVTSSAEAKADADQVGAPKFVNCSGNPVDLPSKISLDCEKNTKVLKDIKWSSITQVSATGTGVLVEGEESTTGAEIQLSQPLDTPQGTVFNKVMVDGKVIPAN